MQSLVSHGLLGFFSDDYVRSGRIMESLEAAMRALHRQVPGVDQAAGCAATADLLQLSAQLMLLLDRPDDALEMFEQCMKHVPRTDKGDRQARSCLIAALHCLERNQIHSAWNCLKRTLEIKGASMPVQVESCAAMAALFYSLGMRRPAATALQHSLELLGRDSAEHLAPRAVLRVMQAEFLVLDVLRQHERLNDLAFWPRHDETARQQDQVGQALRTLAECRASVGHFSLLTSRLDFLEMLLRIAYLGATAVEKAFDHIEQMSRLHLRAYAHAAQHELALACIAARLLDPLRRLMQRCAAMGQTKGAEQYNFEHDYCLAKLGELSGRDGTYIEHYRKYATQSLIQVRRACAYITVPSRFRDPSSELLRDDYASRLPSRYRKAYQFILVNLSRRDLSVREVADSINVTERALQLAFREHLGLSPSGVIRQCRMERIHGDLTDGAAAHGATTLDVAQRWGVGSRAALTNAYKEAYGESPRESSFGAL